MPSTLVHFATQGALSRGLWRRLDARWLYLGCLLPDVPWIVRRAVVAFGLPLDAFDLRLYTMAQASLAGTLLLCGALAVLTAAPRVIFAVLGLNALLHLLLDACEVKWGNGVHLLAPFSWRMASFELVGGESPVLPLLAVAGALLLAWEIARRPRTLTPFDPRPRRLAVAAAFAAAYFAAPFAFLGAIEATDSYSVKTLRQRELRPGREVRFDRTAFVRTPAGAAVEIWTGERLRAVGLLPEHDALVSFQGTFLTPDSVRVDRVVLHEANRDWPSYVALLLLALVWIVPHARRTGC